MSSIPITEVFFHNVMAHGMMLDGHTGPLCVELVAHEQQTGQEYRLEWRMSFHDAFDLMMKRSNCLAVLIQSISIPLWSVQARESWVLDACHRKVGATQSHDRMENSLTSRAYLKRLLNPAFRRGHDLHGTSHSNAKEVECAAFRVCDRE